MKNLIITWLMLLMLHPLIKASDLKEEIDEFLLSEEVTTYSPSLAGYVYNQNGTFFTDQILIRYRVSGTTPYIREGFMSYTVDAGIQATKVEITLNLVSISGADPSNLLISAAETDLVSDITNWSTKPSDELFTYLDTISLASSENGSYVTVDITDFYNTMITNGENVFTIRMSSNTENATQEWSSDEAVTMANRPVLSVTPDPSSCEVDVLEMDTLVCSGAEPVFEGEVQTENGIYYDTLTNKCGADSIWVYNLVFVTDGTIQENVTICAGESYEGYTESGTYYSSISTEDGVCEEITELNLTVNAEIQIDLGMDIELGAGEDAVLDPGIYESYLWSDGSSSSTLLVNAESFGDGGEFWVEVTDEFGCTGRDTINIDIANTFNGSYSPEKVGYVYNLEGPFYTDKIALRYRVSGATPYIREGFMNFDITGAPLANTADISIHLSNLSQADPSNLLISVAESDLVTAIDNWATKPDEALFTYLDTISLGTTDVGNAIQVDVTEFYNDLINNGKTSFTVRLSSNTENALQEFSSNEDPTLDNRPKLVVDADEAGCQPQFFEIDTLVCSGASPVFGGVMRTEDGIYYDSLTRVCGADSVYTYNLTFVSDGGVITENVAICAGESYLGYTESGVYTSSISTTDGFCTEQRELNLTVRDELDLDLGEDLTLSESNNVTLDAGEFATYLWSDGSSASTLLVNAELFGTGGEFWVEVTNEFGCTARDTIIIEIQETSILPFKDLYVTEWNDSKVDNTTLQVKNDLYGDLNNPGVPPYYSRESYLAFDIMELDTVNLSSVSLQLYVSSMTWVNDGNRTSLPLSVGIGDGAYQDDITWNTRPADFGDFVTAGTTDIAEDSIGGFIEVDITEYFNENVKGQMDTISIKLHARSDDNSTLVVLIAENVNDDRIPKLKYVIGEGATGGEELSQKSINGKALIYPNPVSDILYLKGDHVAEGLRVMDLTGQLLLESSGKQVNVGSLSSGIYLVSYKEGGKLKSQRFIVH